jgi:hypothetical protein
LVLTKLVIEAIQIYWMSLAWIPKGILERARRICFKFIWVGFQGSSCGALGKLGSVSIPKNYGVLGFKEHFMFSKSLEAKTSWRLLNTQNLWISVVYQKYISLESLEDWVRSPVKRRSNCTIIWKALINLFPVIGEGFVLEGRERKEVRIGVDLWHGSGNSH